MQHSLYRIGYTGIGYSIAENFGFTIVMQKNTVVWIFLQVAILTDIF